MKNRLLKYLVLGASLVSVAGCKAQVKTYSADDQVLRVFATDAGYGVEWIQEMLDAFQKQDWVKEKYPKLVVEELKKDSTTIPGQLVAAGEKACQYDLLATCQPFNPYIISGKDYFEPLDDVWNSKIPGDSSGLTLKEKSNPESYTQEVIEFFDGSTGVYSVPYVRSYSGVAVNYLKYQQILGDKRALPRTTDEWLSVCSEINTVKQGKDPAFCFASFEHYGEGIMEILWAQYEGKETFYDYFRGIYDGELSPLSLQQQGKLRSLQVLEKLIGASTGNLHKDSWIPNYYKSQAKWASGQSGVFCIGGDWLYNEMGDFSSDEATMDMRFMKMPVISSIIEKTPSIKNDTELIKVVDAVDANKTLAQAQVDVPALTQADYTHVSNARNTHRKLGGHDFAIPSYAMFKDIAKDFILFSATDEAAAIVNSKNCISPWQFDAGDTLKTGYAREVYADSQKSIDLRNSICFRLANYAGLKSLYSGFVFNAFTAEEAKDRKTAQQLYDADVAYYCGNGCAKFNDMLATAGLI